MDSSLQKDSIPRDKTSIRSLTIDAKSVKETDLRTPVQHLITFTKVLLPL